MKLNKKYVLPNFQHHFPVHFLVLTWHNDNATFANDIPHSCYHRLARLFNNHLPFLSFLGPRWKNRINAMRGIKTIILSYFLRTTCLYGKNFLTGFSLHCRFTTFATKMENRIHFTVSIYPPDFKFRKCSDLYKQFSTEVKKN